MYSTRVRAVCDYFGPTDFLVMNEQGSEQDHDTPDSLESQLIGGPIQAHPDAVARADLITYIEGDEPPLCIVHGAADPIVPHAQSVHLRDALNDVGVPVSLYTVEGAGHGGFEDPTVTHPLTHSSTVISTTDCSYYVRQIYSYTFSFHSRVYEDSCVKYCAGVLDWSEYRQYAIPESAILCFLVREYLTTVLSGSLLGGHASRCIW
ncbi:hypothetical protein GCM10009066_21430 [Halarchaeum salinum]|uniref:BD-FAE-like domain-containing protein n=1 Tax=Halarchaeum salinum TaxID=489912 RepID=A0AAV3S9H1_9EURY